MPPRKGTGKNKRASQKKGQLKKRKTKSLKTINDVNALDVKSDADNSSTELLLLTTKPYSCEICSKKFKFATNYNAHKKNEHSNATEAVACQHCPVRCPNVNVLLQHISKVHERQVYSCSTCGTTFSRMSHVKRHQRHGCKNSEISANFLCEICKKMFSRKDNLMVHLRLHILRPNEYKCKHCNYNSSNYSRYLHHIQKHTDKKYECDHCGRVTSSRGSMIKHMEIHGERKFECEVCGYRTFTIEVMRRHVLRHTDDKPFKCDRCPRSFIQVVQLRRHMRRHEGNQCPLCQKEFKSRALLIVHLREHDGKVQLVCQVEGCKYRKPFTTESSYMEHIKQHEERNFACSVCSKRFGSAVTLSRHASVHVLERPRRCMYCASARAYVRGEMLLRHVRTKHRALFADHLAHVRAVLGTASNGCRITKSEHESILNLLDAVTDKIMEQSVGSDNVFYGGIKEPSEKDNNIELEIVIPHQSKDQEKVQESPILSEEELAENIRKLLVQLIDKATLEEFGFPDDDVDLVLERVINQCDAKPAERGRWTRVQRLRENAKYLFLHVVEDKSIGQMLSTHTIDQVVLHILKMTDAADNDL